MSACETSVNVIERTQPLILVAQKQKANKNIQYQMGNIYID